MRALWLAVPLACAVLAGGSLITDGNGIGASVAFAKNDGGGGGGGGQGGGNAGGQGGGHGGGIGGGVGGGQGHAAGPGNSDHGKSMDRGRGPSATGLENRSRAVDLRDRTDRGSRAASAGRTDRRDTRSTTTRSGTSTTTRSASTTRSAAKSAHVKAANSLGNLNAAHASATARANAAPNSMVGRVATYESQMKSALAIQDPTRREAAIIAAREQLALSANKPLTTEAITRVDGLLGIQGASPQLGAVR